MLTRPQPLEAETHLPVLYTHSTFFGPMEWRMQTYKQCSEQRRYPNSCMHLPSGIHQCRSKEPPWKFPSESYQGTLLPWGISHFLELCGAADVALFNRIVTNAQCASSLARFFPAETLQTIQYDTTWTWISITRKTKFNSREKLPYSHLLFIITLSSLVKLNCTCQLVTFNAQFHLRLFYYHYNLF